MLPDEEPREPECGGEGLEALYILSLSACIGLDGKEDETLKTEAMVPGEDCFSGLDAIAAGSPLEMSPWLA